jgi:hypothetical protein
VLIIYNSTTKSKKIIEDFCEIFQRLLRPQISHISYLLVIAKVTSMRSGRISYVIEDLNAAKIIALVDD